MVGREAEVKELMRLYQSSRAELVALYGRRRVGKTYLISETFRNRITFHHAGLSPVNHDRPARLKDQLEQFYYSLLRQGMKKSHRPTSWLEAFFMLEQLLEQLDDGNRQVVFLDELPWMDTPKSGFLTALEGFWNGWACYRPNLMMIVCGSASSWILDKLIGNHGGLYNRVTYQMKLNPFTLKECEAFLTDARISLSRYDIVQSYMILGGIPYYLSYFERGYSLPQNVDNLFFGKGAPLSQEFDRLFASTFSQPDSLKDIVRFLYTRSLGYTRKEIARKLQLPEGGTLTRSLQALIDSDFIIRYVPFGYSKRSEHYKLIDPFCIFWLHFLDGRRGDDPQTWQLIQASPSVNAWRGYAFELTGFNHIAQIKQALGISGVKTTWSAWSVKGSSERGTQIDLLIDRQDNILDSCEMKFTGDEFRVDKDYYLVLLNRLSLLSKEVSPRKAIHHILITTLGLVYNEYSGIFTQTLTLDDLFT